MPESTNIAIAGKGGTGKSSFASLVIKALTAKPRGLILAVDADPNYNLYQKLGLELKETIGQLRERLREAGDEVPAGMTKTDYIKYQIRMILQEHERFDLLTMGRQEGPGCYCYINSVLRNMLDTLASEYSYMIIDNEAGMEHLSRRTNQNMNCLFILSDPSKLGIETAARIRALANEMQLKVGKVIVVANMSPDPGQLPEELRNMIKGYEFDAFYTLPFDPKIQELNMLGKSLLDAPQDSPMVQKTVDILKACGI